MAKLTRSQRKAHDEAEKILTKDFLSDDEKEFVFRNWHEGATHINGAAGAFFTPWDLAGDFALDVACNGGRVIDLCAGIGVLSYFVHERAKYGGKLPDITCVELNPRYVEVGKKLLPEAHWICADVFEWRDWWRNELKVQKFDLAIGNPPFGVVRRAGTAPRYRGPEFEFHVIDIAGELADEGVFIVPQQSAPFRYSGSQDYRRIPVGKGARFEEATGFELTHGVGVDTALYRDDWKDTSIVCEIVCVDYAEARNRRRHKFDLTPLPIPTSVQPAQQLALF